VGGEISGYDRELDWSKEAPLKGLREVSARILDLFMSITTDTVDKRQDLPLVKHGNTHRQRHLFLPAEGGSNLANPRAIRG
jgi:hypothetical protein